jgi:BRCA1 C Terminus (BRCT) domain
MKDPTRPFDKQSFISQVEGSGVDLSELPGNMFQRCSVYFDRPDADLDMAFAIELVKFGGGTVVGSADITTTHVVVGRDAARLSEVRSTISRQRPIPRMVDVSWVLESWREKTILGEERKWLSVGCLVANAFRVPADVVLNNDMTIHVACAQFPFMIRRLTVLNPR